MSSDASPHHGAAGSAEKGATKKSPHAAGGGRTNGVSRSESSSRPAKKATIYDLARVAGVSPGTVSRVLNNRDRVKAETRDRVLRAATELKLKPRASVRFREIAILSEPTFHDRIEGYAATLTAHLSFAFSRRNMGVLLPTNPLEELPAMFLDGIVAVTYDTALRAMLAELETRMPVVYMDKFPLSPKEYGVCSDHYNSGYLAAQHFVARGRRKLGFLGWNYPPFAERLKGYRKAIAEADIPADERLQSLFADGVSLVAAVARLVHEGADAVYAPGSTFQALEFLHVATYVMGVKVPKDIAVIGGENEGISALLNPPLTTIEEPLRDMAEQAADMMDRLTSGARVPQRHVTMPVRLIERDSVV